MTSVQMKTTTSLYTMALPLILILCHGFYTTEWTTVTKDGVEVKSKVMQKDQDGRSLTVASYIATKTADITLDQARSMITHPENYKKYIQFTTKCEEVNRDSELSWTAHLFFDAPFPMGDSDAVIHYKIVDIPDGFKVTNEAVPDSYPQGNVNRMRHSEGWFSFTEMDNGQTKIVMHSEFSPAGNPPVWMMKAWFPKGPATMMNKFIAAAREL